MDSDLMHRYYLAPDVDPQDGYLLAPCSKFRVFVEHDHSVSIPGHLHPLLVFTLNPLPLRDGGQFQIRVEALCMHRRIRRSPAPFVAFMALIDCQALYPCKFKMGFRFTTGYMHVVCSYVRVYAVQAVIALLPG